MQRLALTAVCGFLFLLAGCASDDDAPRGHRGHHGAPSDAAQPPGDAGQRKAFHPPREMIMRYDVNKDGTITLAEMKSVLRQEFAAADANHDGVLDENEARAVNDARWKELGSASTPLIDWNQDGHIDFNEFAGAMLALFDQFDRNQDGTLEPNEINPQVQKKPGDQPPPTPPRQRQ